MRAIASTRQEDGDGGSIMILLVFLVVIIAGLITVIADVSTLFLAQRALQAEADAAVADAAQHPALGGVYAGPGSAVPLTRDDVVAAIGAYLTDPAHAPHNCARGSLKIAARLDGETAAVTMSCDVRLPFVKLVDPSAAHEVSVSSRARLVVS